MLFDLTFLTDIGLLLLRVVVAIVFLSSGWSHATRPQARSESIGLSPTLTLVVGVAEMIAAVSVGLGIYLQLGAALIIGVMLGAIYKKLVVWQTGFYADEGYGWHYDLIFLAAATLFLGTGGQYILLG